MWQHESSLFQTGLKLQWLNHCVSVIRWLGWNAGGGDEGGRPGEAKELAADDMQHMVKPRHSPSTSQDACQTDVAQNTFGCGCAVFGF